MAYTNFTNCTEEQYKSIIYSQEDTNRIRIWFNNVELLDADEYCESFSGTNRILPDDGNKIFTLDNFIAKNYTLVLRDLPEGTIISDQVKVSIGTLVNANNNTYEDVPIGIFNIQDTPTNDKGKVTIKLRDNRVKFDFYYNAQPLIESLGGTATKKQILEDICNQAGVTNNVSTFDGEDDEIGIYDNTITATTYVSYIFEQAGLMPFINREGQLDKINLNDLKVWRIPLSIVEKYEKGTPFKIERVVYESGIIKYESSNDESLDTLYLNSANPYINNKQQIDNIYNLLVGFSADSVKSGKILGNPAIDPFDMILIYDDEINDNPISTSTGTNLTLENTPNASTDIDLLGNTTQETTTGKNLFISSTSSTTTSGMTFTKNSDGSWTLNGTNNSGNNYYLRLNNNFTLQAGTYTLSNSNPNVGTNTAIFYDDAHNFDIDSSYAHNIATKTFTSAVTIKPYIRVNNGATLSNFKIYPMIERGSNYTGFEKYTGTQPSPNPNYPQNIETTTGRNTIDVCGKNLLDMQDGTYSGAGITAIVNNGVITLNGTASGTSFINVPLKNIISINGSFTISANNNFTLGTISNWAGIRLGNVAYDTIGGQTAFSRTNTSETFNVENKDAYYLTIRTASGLSYNNNVIYPQIENGSSSSSYEPYIGNNYEVNLGKNLVSFENLTDATNFGVEISYNKSEIRLNGTTNQSGTFIPYTNLNIPLPAGTYTMSYRFGSGTASRGSGQDIAFILRDKNDNNLNTTTIGQILEASTGVKAQTFTLSNSTTLKFYAYCNNSGVVLNNIVMQIQLEKGSTSSSYSPYFEPIELCKIGTYQDRLFKASGKNLANNNFEDYDITDGSYAILPIKLEYGKTYVLKATLVGEQKANYYNFGVVKDGTTYNNFVGLTLCVDYSTGTALQRTFTIDNTYTNPKLVCFIQRSQTKFNELFTNYNIQLEKSSSATSYEPYGNYWYKYNAIGKVVLDGSENWFYGGVASIFYTTSITDYAISNNIPYSNYYKGVSNVTGASNMGTQNNNTIGFINQSGTTTPRLYIKDTTYTGTSANAIKTWLSNHNTIVYYVLATPTYTKIENDELIGQLNRLKTIQTVEGTTNIQQDSSSSPFELNVEYFNESYILKTLANNTYKYTGINRNEFNTEISLEQRKENVSLNGEATLKKWAKTSIDNLQGQITMSAGEINDLEGRVDSAEFTLKKTGAKLDVLSTNIDEETGNVLGVKTTSYELGSNGFIIDDGTGYKSVDNTTGKYFYDNNSMVGKYTKDGSVQKNLALFGKYYYGVDEEVNVATFSKENAMFVAQVYTGKDIQGNDETGFGHFYNGN